MKLTEAQREVLEAMANGHEMVFSQDGDDAWLWPDHPTGFLSDEQGCRCPRIDNNHGKGYHGLPGCFVYTSGCPLHWPVGSTLGPFFAVEEKGR